MPGALSHHRPQVPSTRRLLQHQSEPRDGETGAPGRLKPGREAYLPVQKGCDQAEVLWMLHEPAGARGRGLAWVPAPTLLAAGLPCPARPEQQGQAAPRGTYGFEKIFVCCSASQKDGNFKFSPVELSWLGALMHRCLSQGGRGQGAGSA